MHHTQYFSITHSLISQWILKNLKTFFPSGKYRYFNHPSIWLRVCRNFILENVWVITFDHKQNTKNNFYINWSWVLIIFMLLLSKFRSLLWLQICFWKGLGADRISQSWLQICSVLYLCFRKIIEKYQKFLFLDFCVLFPLPVLHIKLCNQIWE